MRQKQTASPVARQRGGFLLEALIGILIFTLGVLGLVALQARAIGYSSDTQYRGEAAYLANAYISKMWADSRANLHGPIRRSGRAGVRRLRGRGRAASRRCPDGDDHASPRRRHADPPGGAGMALNDNSTLVTIVINWQQPANERSAAPVTHNYTISSVLGLN